MKTPIKSEARKLIFNMINKFDVTNKDNEKIFNEKEQCLVTILEAIGTTYIFIQWLFFPGVSLATIKRIKKEGQLNNNIWSTPGKKRPHPSTVSNLDNFDICAIRNKINEFYTVKKQVPTIRNLLAELRDAIGFTGSRETLRRILHDNGYEFKKNSNERSLLIERYENVAWRRRFLRKMCNARQENKHIVYLDETYIHQNYKPKKSWQGPSTSGLVDKISAGKRHIIVHAGSKEGFVPNALLIYSTKSVIADYHHDMNATNFKKPSIVVMDNASYHTCQINKAPTTQTRKSVIQNWLRSQGVPFEDYLHELLCLVKKHKPDPIYEVDEILKQHGHEAFRLPPYHCDLNAIEMIWSLAKRRVASKNIGVTPGNLEQIIKDAFESVKVAVRAATETGDRDRRLRPETATIT
ncbi:hypothetical protein HF086_012305 [Spodoptera exigua]|uniref:Tc1-like transposase DDE domain-containing protein n=1 Tax=Spodoptera exigua TaxID=7107 RepID=A0A922SMG1_SPOEX|nr:hypothetical protein HF086_012305 [Spodoptera exigua]